MAVSKYDKEHMSAAEQAKVEELTSQAQSGTISWDKAHREVETIRNKYGYSGGADGSGYSASYGGSTYDRQNMTDKELADIASARADAVMGTTDWDSAHSYAENTRANYGYSGGDDGSKYIPLEVERETGGGGFSYASAPSYTNKYQSQIDELTQQILGREAFSYDPEKDPTYQQYKESYTRSGERAMQDTLGQVAARTGGLASSYAGSAAQQAYDNYMAALADKIPELKQLAYSMYQDEGTQQRANLEMLMALEQGDYAKYADLLAQYNTDRSFDYGVFSDQRNYDYQLGRDQMADSRYEDETAYNREQDAWQKANYTSEKEYDQALAKAQTLAAAGDFSGYKALGYSDAEISNLKTAYDRAQAAAKLTGSGGSKSSGSGSSGTGTVQDYDGLFKAAEESGHARSFISNNYKSYGFTSSSGLYNDYESWAEDHKDDDGYNSAQFQAAMRVLSATLAQGLTDGAVDGINSFWDKLSEEQRAEVQALLAKYGYSYEEE